MSKTTSTGGCLCGWQGEKSTVEQIRTAIAALEEQERIALTDEDGCVRDPEYLARKWGPAFDRFLADQARVERDQALKSLESEQLNHIASIESYRQKLSKAENIERAFSEIMQGITATRGDIAGSEERTQFAVHKGFEDMEPVKTGVAILVAKKHTRSRNGKAAQRKAKNDPEIQSLKKRAENDKHRALERVRDDPDVTAGKQGAVTAACRRLCDWTDKKGHIHHGKFEQLTTAKRYGEPQYAPLMDWQGKPIKPETLARYFRDQRKTKPKLKRGKK